MGAIAARNRRARIAKKLRVPKVHELRYQHALTSAMRTLHTEALDYIRPRLGEVAQAGDSSTHRDAALDYIRPRLGEVAQAGDSSTHRDAAISDDFERKVAELAAQLATSISPAFNRMAVSAMKNNARALRSMGLDVRDELGVTLDHIRDANIALMKNASKDFADQVRTILSAPDSWGLTVDSLAAQLQERADVSESRAALIARDQTSKTNGLINQTRQQAAGINSYVWSGSLDERERETHVDNEGQTFSWYSPPPETGHPTEDVNCRCCAIPVLPGEGDDE